MHFTAAVLNYSNAVPFLIKRGRLFKCAFNCLEVLGNAQELRVHTQTFHKVSIKRLGLTKNIMRVDVTDLKCEICSTNMDKLTDLQEHFTVKHNIQTYTDCHSTLVPYKINKGDMICQMCDQKFDNVVNIEKHMESHFMLHVCETCGLGFMTEAKMKQHSLCHKEKKFICPECDAPFPTSYSMKRHVEYIHQGLGFLRCWLCPGRVRFKLMSEKQDHMAEKHNGEKRPIPTCPVCKKVFTAESTIKIHMRRFHEESEKHPCADCGEIFHKKSSLDDHVRRKHLGFRIPCFFCSKQYSILKDLCKHMKVKHEKEDRKCPCWKCGVPCGNRYKLKLHMAEKHQEPM